MATKRNRLLTEPRKCFWCHCNGCGDPLERHHIFGGALRDKSERYGLVVDLCGDTCHRNGAEAVHINTNTAQILHEYGQRKAMEENGWTVEDFRREFYKSYL